MLWWKDGWAVVVPVRVEAVEARKVVAVVVVNAPPMLPPLGVFTQAQSAD